MLYIYLQIIYRRIREKYEGELGELEKNERHTTEKYNQLKVSRFNLLRNCSYFFSDIFYR